MTSTGWWIVGLAALVTFVLGAVVQRWQEKRRRTPEQADEHEVIHALWRLAKRVPVRQLLHDPVTRQYLGVARHHTFLEVLVSDVDFTAPDLPADAVVTAYGLGAAGRPMPAPILRQQYPADPELVADRTLRQASEMLAFNDQTGAMDASLEELRALHAQLERALRGH